MQSLDICGFVQQFSKQTCLDRNNMLYNNSRFAYFQFETDLFNSKILMKTEILELYRTNSMLVLTSKFFLLLTKINAVRFCFFVVGQNNPF